MKLGKIETVELREIWKSEAKDFTPWLAEEEHIKLLGDTLGMDLEVQSQEEAVGPFRADILCLNTVDDSYVLIENQLEKTDHTHLGQLLTYAAGLDAVSIVWISPNFTEEHRATLDWLNRKTDDTINFFGVEVEIFKIGESLPAPLFTLVSKPNEWSKIIKKGIGNITDTKKLQMEYWQALKNYIESTKSPLKSHSPGPHHWTNYSIGRSKFYLSGWINTKDNFIAVGLIISGSDAIDYFNTLKKKYENDSYLGLSKDLEWRDMPESKEKHVELKKNNESIFDKNNWPEQHKWLKTQLESFSSYFKSKIKVL